MYYSTFLGTNDINVQSISDRVKAFWYGFKDLGSGIVRYEACLSYFTAVGECHLVDFIDTGIATSITFELEENLQNGLYDIFSFVRKLSMNN